MCISVLTILGINEIFYRDCGSPSKENDSRRLTLFGFKGASTSVAGTPSYTGGKQSEYVASPSNAVTASRTPLGTSKLLRDRLEKDAVECVSHPRRLRRRLLESGALRLGNKNEQNITLSPKQFTPSRRRVGYDGTPNTPSRELLSTTACFRNRQIQRQRSPTCAQPLPPPSQHHHQQQSVTHFGLNNHQMIVDAELTAPSTSALLSSASFSSSHTYSSGSCDGSENVPRSSKNIVRRGCVDPVALTLWNGGKEDMDYLIEIDRTSTIGNNFHGRCVEISERCSRRHQDSSEYLSHSLSYENSEMSASPAEPTNELIVQTTIVARPVPRRLSRA